MKKIFINKIGRRQFLKTSLSGLALAAFPSISFAQSNLDGAATDVFISDALD